MWYLILRGAQKKRKQTRLQSSSQFSMSGKTNKINRSRLVLYGSLFRGFLFFFDFLDHSIFSFVSTVSIKFWFFVFFSTIFCYVLNFATKCRFAFSTQQNFFKVSLLDCVPICFDFIDQKLTCLVFFDCLDQLFFKN